MIPVIPLRLQWIQDLSLSDRIHPFSYIKRVVFFAVILPILFLMPASDARALSESANALPADTIAVTIFHSNDVYGEMSRRRSQDEFVGGMAPRIGLIRRARRYTVRCWPWMPGTLWGPHRCRHGTRALRLST